MAVWRARAFYALECSFRWTGCLYTPGADYHPFARPLASSWKPVLLYMLPDAKPNDFRPMQFNDVVLGVKSERTEVEADRAAGPRPGQGMDRAALPRGRPRGLRPSAPARPRSRRGSSGGGSSAATCPRPRSRRRRRGFERRAPRRARGGLAEGSNAALRLATQGGGHDRRDARSACILESLPAALGR